MSKPILRVWGPSVKPGSAEPDPPCPSCKGLGRIVTAEGEETCDRCEGQGSVIEIEESSATEVEAPYLATVGDALLDTGANLGRFVEEMRQAFPETADDIVITRTDVDGLGSMAVVALIRPNPGGKPVVQWM